VIRAAALAGLVDRKAADDRDQELLAGDGEVIGHPARAEDGQDPVGVSQGVGTQRDAAEGEPYDVAVPEDGCSLAARDLLELLPPTVGVGVGDGHLADHAIEHQVEQPILRADVPVQGRG
jgi:hypothetical protein